VDIEQLRAFERIVREGSFSRAARSMDLTQPTISARISGLERTVGGPLFVRSGRRLTLTPRGEQFLPYVRRALAVLAEGVEVAAEADSGERGRVTLGVVQSLSLGFLTDAVGRFCARRPRAELFIRAAQSNQVVEMLNDGLVRLGLMAWPFYGADMAPLLRFREELTVVVPAGRGPQEAAALADLARTQGPFWLVQWTPSITALLTRLVADAGQVVEAPAGTLRELLLRGQGVGVLTRTLVAEDLAAGRLVEVAVTDLPRLYRESALVQLARSGRPTGAAQEMIAVLRDTAADYGILQPDDTPD
jgi:DNA-binding transcriptional LysR family regulator